MCEMCRSDGWAFFLAMALKARSMLRLLLAISWFGGGSLSILGPLPRPFQGARLLVGVSPSPYPTCLRTFTVAPLEQTAYDLHAAVTQARQPTMTQREPR